VRAFWQKTIIFIAVLCDIFFAKVGLFTAIFGRFLHFGHFGHFFANKYFKASLP
jgi:hypothetical protein